MNSFRFTRIPRRAALALALAASLARPAAGADAFKAADATAEAALGRHALRLLDGSRTTLAELRGQVVVVNFWASWCAPCRRELPRLDALHRELGAQGVRVLAVSIDVDAENAARFVKAGRLSLPVAHDGPAGLARALDLRHVPATVVLDREGRIAWSTGRSDDAALAALESRVRDLLAGGAVAAGRTGGGGR